MPCPMYVIGLDTAAPSHRHSQAECWEALGAAPQVAALTPCSRAILKKVLLGDGGIVARHLVLTPLSEAFDTAPRLSPETTWVHDTSDGVNTPFASARFLR